MRHLFIILILLFSSNFIYSQNAYKAGRIQYNHRVDEKKIHFGFTLGANVMDYNIWNSAKDGIKAEQVTFSPGFSVGLISDLKLNENFSLRFQPGLEFGDRTVLYSNSDNFEVEPFEAKTQSVIIGTPLFLKYRAKRVDNYRPYLIGGVSYKIDVESPLKIDIEGNEMFRMQPNYFAIEFGAGIDFYLPYFKFATELKVSLGLQDILNHNLDSEYPDLDFYTYSIKKMNSKIITLSFHFE